ncbi:MAG TPA: hypothetical protein VIK57_21485 [Streptosporangiaceae bacterium]
MRRSATACTRSPSPCWSWTSRSRPARTRTCWARWPISGRVTWPTWSASWLGHNAITEYLDRANATFIRLNLLLLLLIAFLPFPTRLFADYIGKDQPERIAATIYGVSLLLSSTLLWALWRYAVHAGLVRPDAAD